MTETRAVPDDSPLHLQASEPPRLATPDSGWHAHLNLSFARVGARTVLSRREHRGPLRVLRPFYPEGEEVCHLYVLHPPGGLVGGDRVQVNASVLPGAHALLTTPAAGKLYRSKGASVQQTTHLQAHAGGVLEWLPQENIAFSGAQAELTTRVELASDARFIGWELSCLGRPAAAESFSSGQLQARFEVYREGRPLHLERAFYRAGDEVLRAPWGLAGQPVVGSVVCIAPAASELVEPARALLATRVAGDLAAVSGWDDVLIARYLGPSVERARGLFVGLWSLLRPALLGRPASAPRIWRT
jgi:urease accessory protein